MSTVRGIRPTTETRSSVPIDGRDGYRPSPGAGLWAEAVARLAPAKGPQSYLATGITAGLLVAAWVCNLFHLPHPLGFAAIGWLPGALALIVATAALHATARLPNLAPAAGRFWRLITVVATLGSIAMLIRAGHAAVVGPAAVKTVPPAAVIVGSTGVCLAIWALLRIPVGRLTRRHRLRLTLDTVTIVLAAALIMWYVAVGPLVVESPGNHAVWGRMIICTLCLIGLSAVVRVALLGSGPIDPAALKLLGLSIVASGVCSGTASVINIEGGIVPGQVSVPVIGLLLALAARRQAVAALDPTGRRVPRLKRTYSLLPYAAVLVIDVLLVVAVWDSAGAKARVVVVGVIIVTAVVVSRQLTAFADNARLVHELRSKEYRLRHQADHDSLTQLANRTLFTERLDAALADGWDSRLAVLLIDLDDFKSVNDTLGHAIGDQLLFNVAARLRHCIRVQDTVARLGGDEFGVLLCGVDPPVADATAARILADLSAPVPTDGLHLLVRASIGVAVAKPGDDSGTLLRNADIAMYAVKERGKGAHLRYAPGMATNVLEHAQLGAQLREAIGAGQLYPVYQPVVNLTEHRILGIETLVRWQHPIRDVVSPAEFITTAERTGLIVPLGRWLLGEACAQLAAWKRAYGPHAPATIGVNVSGRQLAEPDYPGDVEAAVRLAGLEPHNLVLEVTEDAVLTSDHAQETLEALHEIGVMIALDDFGTGNSSLGLLRMCPVNIVKLDKSFVEGIAEDPTKAAIASALMQIAKAMGLDAVAEGIEDADQLEFLLDIGYYLGQGFYLAPPLPAAAVARMFGKPTVTANRGHLVVAEAAVTGASAVTT